MTTLLITALFVLATFNILLAIGLNKSIGRSDIKQIKFVYNAYNTIVILSYLILGLLYSYILILTYGSIIVMRQLVLTGLIVVINLFIAILAHILFIIRDKKNKYKC